MKWLAVPRDFGITPGFIKALFGFMFVVAAVYSTYQPFPCGLDNRICALDPDRRKLAGDPNRVNDDIFSGRVTHNRIALESLVFLSQSESWL
jgi:hypothetical protein